MRTHRVVPRSILYDARKQLQVANPNNKNLVGIATIELLRPHPTCPLPKSLTTLSERDELQGIACFRDKNNNGMMRKEMILLVMDFTGCCKWKLAENHLDFLICAGKLPNLKRGGRTVSAQKTTAKHSQITIEQQRLCWHGNIESVWQEQLQLNHPNEEFSALKAHFICNVDETGKMADLAWVKKSDGRLVKEKTRKEY